MLARTLAFGCVLLMSTATFGQDLSGTWVSEFGDGAECTLTHVGNTIKATAWGGPANPDLKGSHALSGGPAVFRGTWENSKPGWAGSGSIVYHVVDKDTILVAYAGIVVSGGNKAPTSDAGRMLRKGSKPGDPLTGKWLYAVEGIGNSTMAFTPRADGQYDVVFSGGGADARGTATLVKDQLTVVATTNDGRYSGTATFTMSGRTGVGSVKWDKQPADDTRVSPFKCTLTFIPDAKP